jgi:gas vesicle protein
MAFHDDEEGGGGSGSGFIIGLLTGTVLGAGLGILFAPKSGSETRGQISDKASAVGRAASEHYQKAASAATELAGKGRAVVGRAVDAVSRLTDEGVRRSGDGSSPKTSESGSVTP